MNERIKELAEQARRYYLTLPTGYSPEQVGMYRELMEKFAELIIQECIECIDRVGILEDVEFQSGMIAQNVREHFGVNDE